MAYDTNMSLVAYLDPSQYKIRKVILKMSSGLVGQTAASERESESVTLLMELSFSSLVTGPPTASWTSKTAATESAV